VAELILHHYPESPFSEKVRLALGLKRLAWRSVQIPNMLPKPDLTPLTGGYRKTPVLQVGADVWCDTQCIVRALEQGFPEPSLYPSGTEGLAHALLFFTDRELFQAAVRTLFGTVADAVPKAFYEDRSALMGTEFTPEVIKAGLPAARDQLRAHLDLLERTLAGGGPFLLGDAPGLADLNAYHTVWFLKRIPPVATFLAPYTAIGAWSERVAAIGHGSPTEMDAKEALEIARATGPDTAASVDEADPNGRRPGDRVRVYADDYGRDPVEGEIVASSTHEIAILRRDERVGEVVVHFPRAGFVVEPA
jgi:glutathione S-transferase